MKWRNPKKSLHAIARNEIPIGNPNHMGTFSQGNKVGCRFFLSRDEGGKQCGH